MKCRPSFFATAPVVPVPKNGSSLSDAQRRFTAKVRADGTLVSADAKGSIHQVGAYVQGAQACNGWTFWHVEIDGALAPVDVLRQRLRAELN